MTRVRRVRPWRIARAWLLAVAVAAPQAVHASACDEGRPLQRDSFVRAVQRSAPAVVQVVVLRAGRDPMADAPGFEFFQPLQGLPLPGREAVERTFSSGFFIEPDGLLLASAHSVFDALEIWVVAADGKRFRAAVIGMDRRRDVALLKVDADGMPVVEVAQPTAICAGQWVIAIGTPFGFDQTVSAGIVSAYPRYLHGSGIPLIQSDVVLNPGSSGGPLVGPDGSLVGMSTMIFSLTGIYVGVSFALPVDELMRVAQALRTSGQVRAGEIGVRQQPLTPDLARAFGLEHAAGALVTRVADAGPAARAGLRAGDVILGLAPGERLPHQEIEARLGAAAPGTVVNLQVWRGAGSGGGGAERIRRIAAGPCPGGAPEGAGRVRRGPVCRQRNGLCAPGRPRTR